MHGTREKCNYNTTIGDVKYDVGYFFQKDAFLPVKVIGIYYMAPWNITIGATGLNNNTYWIWATDNAHIGAPGDTNGYYYWFYFTFYYNGLENSGKIYSSCDNYSKLYFNNIFINDNNGGWGGSTVITHQVTIQPGLNYLRIAASNQGYGDANNNPAGLLVSVVDSNNNNVANTNSNWAYSTSTSFNNDSLTFNTTAT